MVLRKHEVEGCFRVDVIHRELPPVEPFCIGWKFPLMEIRADLNPGRMRKPKPGRFKAHDPRKLLLGLLNTTAEDPSSFSAWAEAAGAKRQTLTGYLPDMRAKGWIATTGEGNKVRYYLTEKGQNVAWSASDTGATSICRK
jgi:hypothetical protein